MKSTLLILAIAGVAASGCSRTSEPAKPHTVPVLSTAAVTNITTTGARSGGSISSDGGIAVTASGICWSKTSSVPTISLPNDTTKDIAITGTFTSNMKNLSSGTTYYVRAYAINSVGVGYGDVVSFNTSNNAPEAKDISIVGSIKVAETVVAGYTYVDVEGNPESNTGFQWYIASDTMGAPVTAIANATDRAYLIRTIDQDKFLRVGITPRSSVGASPGIQATSKWLGPVGAAEPTTVTFVYNGQNVTYGIITSAVTQRKWMDRNLGAPAAATGYDDWQNKGDLFQWGRKADGHQLINRAATTAGTTGVNATTANLSSSDDPGHALFIVTSVAPFDWRNPQNAGLWTPTGGVNNACPLGWHVPTRQEWEAEQIGTVQQGYTALKITTGGARNFNDGSFSNTINDGLYWSSTLFNGASSTTPYSFNFSALTGPAYSSTANLHSMGLSVRCIKD